MSPRLARRRPGVVALTCAGLTVSAGALGALGTTATAAPSTGQGLGPVADCAQPFPVADVARGDTVTGLTVVSDTDPVGFTGEVLGVLQDGIAPDIDMIMVDLAMDAFDETGGVWQGMSGSPVYAADGRLLGAVAYGLSYGASTIAGLTPYEFMDDYLTPGRPAAPTLTRPQARTIAARAGITERQAAQGFRELPIPFGVAGVPARLLQQAQERGPEFLRQDTYVLGRADADAAGPETIVAGGNLAASAAYGDVTFAGVGTATSVCNGDVVGFGHPLYQLGETTEGLHPADAIYIQPDSLGAPFKVANIGPIAGTIDQDRLSGISGTFGPAPDAAVVTSTVTRGDVSRTGSTAVSVADALPDATFLQLLANSDRVLGGSPTGTAIQGWTVTGDDDGTPFELSFTDRYTGGDLVFDPLYQLSDLTYGLAGIPGVTVDAITADTTVTDDTTTYKIGAVDQIVAGTWTRVDSDAPVRVRPGGVLRLRVTLTGSAGNTTVRIPDLAIPRDASGRAKLSLRGGANFYSYFYGRSIHALQKRIDEAVRHDQLQVSLEGRGTAPDQTDAAYRRGPRGPQTPEALSLTSTAGPVDHVVDGRRNLRVRIAP